MAVKIRFARVGKKHAPIYKIVAIDSRRKRDGMYLENLGTYNPKTKQMVQFHDERVAHWIAQGAQPTDAVVRLMKMRKYVQPAPAQAAKAEVVKAPKKSAPKKVAKTSENSTKSE
jgi:small subunit ribosomal protein S16